MLSDGLWSSDVAEAAWPPATTSATGSVTALPGSTVLALSRLAPAKLRLQLATALDAWPWERELAVAAPDVLPVARYLTDLPDVSHLAVKPVPLLAAASGTLADLSLVQMARRQHRPLVLADSSMPAAQRVALERGLRSHWRDSLLLSQALARTLRQLDLPLHACRLYGDGGLPFVDTEQGWRPVTVLSIDLVSSTRLLHALGAEAYSLRLQAYHERCREVVLRNQGSPEVPQGDGLMAYFGFPLAVEDAAAHALTAAWQLSCGLTDLDLEVRIGVASGQMAVNAHQAFGPEVHLAARLCAAARPGQILVAPSTRDRVGSGVLLEPRGDGPLTLKDFDNLEAVHELRGLRPAAVGPAAGTAGGSSGFVGRRVEINRLREAWSTACAGQLQWCVVHGDAGIGKSRLLFEFAGELRAQRSRCLEWTGQVHAGSSPFAAVIDGLRRHLAINPDTDIGRLQHRLADLLPSLRRQDGALGDLARLLLPSLNEPATGSARWSELLLACLHALIEPGPLCLLVDDAHWLDASSIELLRRLRDTCGERALLVVVGERTERGHLLTLPGRTTLELQGLSAAEAAELAGQLGAALPEPVRRRIIERAEGVPLFLEESVRMLNHRDREVDGDVPATLEDLLMVRLDELGPDRVLAQLVSVLGREFSSVHLDALLEQSDPFVERARQQGSVGSLLDSGMLQPLDGPQPGLRFKHALLRDAAYGSIWTDDRKRVHGLCADLIERCTPELGRQRPELLAHHFQAAGRAEQARRAWLAAAKLAAARFAHQETVELAQRALVLHGQVPEDAERTFSAMDLHLLVASAQIALQGYSSLQVEAAYLAAERASRTLTDSTPALRIRLGLEACCVMRGDLARAAELAEACVAATDWTQDARLALQSRWALANVQFHQGDWAPSLAGLDECLAHYQFDLHRRSGVQDPAVMCLGYSSWTLFELGQADEALRRIERILSLSETLQHPFSSGIALSFAASLKRLCGDVEGAWRHAQEAVQVCERGGFKVWLAHAWMVRGQLRSDRGDVRGGDEDMERGYAGWAGSGARISCATYLVTRAEIRLRQGRTAHAGADLEQAWQISEQIGEHYYQAELLRLQGLRDWQAGERIRAEQTLNRALDLAHHQRKPGLALRCALSLGALQASQGQWRIAAQRLSTLLSRLHQHGSSRDDRWARQALSCWESGRTFASAEATPWEPA
ncbi:MAG: hypothetical protein AD742_19470 [Methylibium sp. NZG]|nr:MAG: hypothetical protein AD742_19470 [Methylibium sp. NZG]